MALWAGRFSKEIDAGVNAFNSSIAFDARMYRHDIQGSIAHATMLGDCGIISKEDSKTIIEGLTAILADLDSGKLEFDPNAEDIHMFVEAELTKRYGDVGKRLHTSRSRNDQVALDLRLYLRDEIQEIRGLVEKLCAVLVKLAEQHTETVLPGYTHALCAVLPYTNWFRLQIFRFSMTFFTSCVLSLAQIRTASSVSTTIRSSTPTAAIRRLPPQMVLRSVPIVMTSPSI